MRVWKTAVVAIGVVLLPRAAGAFDLTGTWVGKLSCRGNLVGKKDNVSAAPSTLLVTQNAGFLLSADGIFYAADAIADPAKPTRGEIAIIRCGTTAQSGEFGGEIGRMKVSTNPAKGTGTLSGTSYRTDVLVASSVYTCRWSYKRISTTPPPLSPCP